jgi:hypothetical protein
MVTCTSAPTGADAGQTVIDESGREPFAEEHEVAVVARAGVVAGLAELGAAEDRLPEGCAAEDCAAEDLTAGCATDAVAWIADGCGAAGVLGMADDCAAT